MVAELARELLGVRLGALVAQREGPQATEREEGFHRAGDRAVAAASLTEPVAQVTRVRDGRAEDHIRVAGQELGNAVEHDVGTVIERSLSEWRRECVVDRDEHVAVVRAGAPGGKVGDFEERVGG